MVASPLREADMSAPDQPDDSMHLSVKEMQGWLNQEIRDSLKACELRVKEASALVTAYAMGELTPQMANERLRMYEDRWGEALSGTTATSHMTDEAITAKIDAMHATRRAWRERYQRGYDLPPEGPPKNER
jgi:hypothetical protein